MCGKFIHRIWRIGRRNLEKFAVENCGDSALTRAWIEMSWMSLSWVCCFQTSAYSWGVLGSMSAISAPAIFFRAAIKWSVDDKHRLLNVISYRMYQYMFICFSLFVFLSVCLSVSLSVSLSVCLSVCLYVCLYVSSVYMDWANSTPARRLATERPRRRRCVCVVIHIRWTGDKVINFSFSHVLETSQPGRPISTQGRSLHLHLGLG